MTLSAFSSCLHLPNPEMTSVCHHVLWLHPYAFLNLIRILFHTSGVPGDPTRLHPSKRDRLQQPTVTRARVYCLGHSASAVTTPGAAQPLGPRCPPALCSPGLPVQITAPAFSLGPCPQPGRGVGAARQDGSCTHERPPESQGSSERVPGEERRPHEPAGHPGDGYPGRVGRERGQRCSGRTKVRRRIVMLKALGHQISDLRVRVPPVSLTRFWASSPAEAASQVPSCWTGEGGWG